MSVHRHSARVIPATQVQDAKDAELVLVDLNKLNVAVRKSIGWIWVVRVLLTLAIVGYIATILAVYTRAPDDDEASRRNAEFSHKVLFGHAGLVPVLFLMWILTILAVAAAPLLLHVLHRLGLVDKGAK